METIRQVQHWMNGHEHFVSVVLAIFGCMVGSFLNVVIHRLPLEQSIVKPRSRCPACENQIAWYDNIPILSFLWLGFCCRHCRKPISWRYPLVEALTGTMTVLLFLRFGASLAFLVYFLFVASLIAITFIDLDHRIIPNEISLGGIVVFFVLSFLGPTDFWKDSLIGIGAGGGGLFLIAWTYSLIRGREGMGMGDVKLMAMFGAVFGGWLPLLFIIMLASMQGVIVTVGMVLVGVKLKPPLPEEVELEQAAQERTATENNQEQEEEKEEEEVGFMAAAIPFGPFLSLAAVEFMFFGQYFYDLLSGRA